MTEMLRLQGWRDGRDWADWGEPARWPAAWAWAGGGHAAEGRALALADSGPCPEAYSEPDITLSPRINLGGHWPCLNGLHSFLPPWLLAILGQAQHFTMNSMNSFNKVILNETPTQTNDLIVWDVCEYV